MAARLQLKAEALERTTHAATELSPAPADTTNNCNFNCVDARATHAIRVFGV
jgi:hypothetical protein